MKKPNPTSNVRIFKHEEETIRLGGTEADKPEILGQTQSIPEEGVVVSRELAGTKPETLGMNEPDDNHSPEAGAETKDQPKKAKRSANTNYEDLLEKETFSGPEDDPGTPYQTKPKDPTPKNSPPFSGQ